MNATTTTRKTEPLPAETIAETVRLFRDPEGAIEIRAIRPGEPPVWRRFPPGSPRDTTAEYIAEQSAGGRNCYVTLNPIDPSAPAGQSARDRDILARRWLLVDVDPTRPAEVSATAEEKQHARDVIDRIRGHLTAEGWPAPVVADSGNGYHLLYRVDLPNDDDAKELVVGTLKALAKRFDTEHAHVDVKVGNAGRITCAYGTIKRKGESSPDRPHRRSAILEAPNADPVPRALLEKLASPSEVLNGPNRIKATAGTPDRIARASAYLATLDPAISGQHGHDATFRAACKLVEFGLSEGEVLGLLAREYNPHCQPPWSDAELAHKVADAFRENGHRHGAKLTEVKPAPAGTPSEDKRPSQKATLTALVADDELFHDAESIAYARILVGDHHEVLRVDSKPYRNWITRATYEALGEPPGSEALSAAVNLALAQAVHDGPQHEVSVRTGGLRPDGGFSIDLGDASWRAVHVQPGSWTIGPHEAVRFRRPNAMKPLPTPRRGGSIRALRRFVNVATDEDFLLLVAWITAALRPTGPYPVLLVEGEQGSAKSTLSRAMRHFVDPCKAPLRCEPRDARDLAVAAGNAHVVGLDNLSSLRDWLSDALCRLATGGGFATRMLYADFDEAVFDAMRPVIINGIAAPASRPDLLDRAILLTLPTIPEAERRTERAFWSDLESAEGKILGALLDLVAEALVILPAVRLSESPRMADFAEWGEAVGRAMGLGDGAFLRAYEANRSAVNEAAAEASPVVLAIATMLPEAGASWSGTTSELRAKLLDEVSATGSPPADWPKTNRQLASDLRRQTPVLRRMGITVAAAGRSNRGRRLVLRREQAAEKRPPRDDTHTTFPVQSRNSHAVSPYAVRASEHRDCCDCSTQPSRLASETAVPEAPKPGRKAVEI